MVETYFYTILLLGKSSCGSNFPGWHFLSHIINLWLKSFLKFCSRVASVLNSPKTRGYHSKTLRFNYDSVSRVFPFFSLGSGNFFTLDYIHNVSTTLFLFFPPIVAFGIGWVFYNNNNNIIISIDYFSFFYKNFLLINYYYYY